ncbi:CIR protein PIR protein, fragment [Plasmodium vinckei brucechwatti]|uniref:CIR protein PIR protein n=1 Tax=Plasmodium vinckei brucechwatti TaxID=119398 RepID=A0A6V7RWI4_PLAVN|nr:CIR protein PIR protein, fragment [Plasmodium vinckei brucechwatti]
MSGVEAYNSCKDIINKKIYLKTIGIKEIPKLYGALKNLYSSITGNSSYREILSILSTDYNNFKSYCDGKCNCYNNILTLPEIKTPPSSSIASKLISVLLIFVIQFFLEITYKIIFKRKAKKHKEENGSLYVIRRVVVSPGTIIVIDIC